MMHGNDRIDPLVTSILSATIFLIGMSASAIVPYRGIVAVDELHLSNAAYAVITSISSCGTAVVALLMGHFADKIRDRRLGVLICAAFSAAAYALIFFSPSQLSYIIAFCVILPFGGALFSQAFSYARVFYDRAQASGGEFMMSALRTLYSLAWVVAPAIVGWVAARYSVIGAFGTAAAAQLTLVLVFSALYLLPQARIGAPASHLAEGAPAEGIALGRIVGIGGIMVLRATLFLHAMAVPLFLTNSFHASLTQVSLTIALCAGMEIPFMLGWGYVALRWSKEMIITLNALLYALYLGLIYFAHSVEGVLWLQGLNAAATAGLVSIPISYMQESIKGRVALSTALFDVVTVAAQICASAVFALFSFQTDYMPVLLAAAAMSVLGGAAVWGSGTASAARRLRTG